MSHAINIHSLSFTYGQAAAPALDNVAAAVEDGSFVVVMGHGGAGKSTLCCTMNGLIPHFFKGAYAGRVIVGGYDVAEYSIAAMSRMVGLIFQDFEAQLFSSTVELEMAFGPENQQLTRMDIGQRITRYLNLVGLTRKRKRETTTLSGGEKQRLCIGSVLAAEPGILVMDEATTDLDPAGRRDVLSLAGVLRQEGRTLVMVDESPETAVDADQIWLMKEGRLLAKGPPQKLLADLPLLESCGVGALPTVALFSALGWPGLPLTVEEALALIDQYGLVSRDRSQPITGPASLPGAPILSAQGLSYRYAACETPALQDIDLAIGEGEFIAILGQNGSGKTTLAKHFNGLLKPTSGRMLVSGRLTSAYKRYELARQVGYVFQNPDHQIFAPTVREEVSFGLRVLGEDAKTLERNVAEAMAVTGLAGYEDKTPFLLSRGEKQRVAVASVLAIKPRVIVLDEPMTGLDDRHQRDALEMLKRLHRMGHTIVMITHAMRMAEAYARRVVLMKDGRIIGDGPTRSIFADETLLSEASLIPSPLARLSNRLGLASLTLEGIIEEIKAPRA